MSMAQIFIDFDRTLFDTNRFYNEHERFIFESKPRTAFTSNFARFLYDDVLYFLQWCRENGHHCDLLTFGSREVQGAKFELCNIAEYFTETFYVEQGSKVDAVYSYISQFPDEKIVFIDDTFEHLEAFHVKLRQTTCLLMKRTRSEGSELLKSAFPVISTLAEAQEYI